MIHNRYPSGKSPLKTLLAEPMEKITRNVIGCSAQVGNSVKVPVGVDADALVPNKPSEILKSPLLFPLLMKHCQALITLQPFWYLSSALRSD